MNKTCRLRIVLFIILSLAWPQQRVFAQSTEEIQKQILEICNSSGRSENDRAACRKHHLDEMREFIALRSRYSKDSPQYQTLEACSKEWPRDVLMWRMCASGKMPEESAFKYDLLKTPTWAGQPSSADLTGAVEKTSPETLKKIIVRRCHQTEDTDKARATCRQYYLERLREYVVLLNSYPKNSKQYKTLVACSEEWPEAIVMWKTCASRAMPEELAFKPFSLVSANEDTLMFQIDPRDTVADQSGRVPLMPFKVKLSSGQQDSVTPTRTTPQMFTPDGVYIPGGAPR